MRVTKQLTMLVAIFYLPADPWPKAFLALGTLFLVFTPPPAQRATV